MVNYDCKYTTAAIGRGTEPPLALLLPQGSTPDDFSFIRLIASQHGKTAFVKEKSAIVERDGKYYFNITQQDTFRLSDQEKVKLQLRYRPLGGLMSSTEPIFAPVRELTGPQDVI